MLLNDVAFELDMKSKEINFEELLTKFQIRPDKDNKLSFAKEVKQILNMFMNKTATNTALLLQKLDGFVHSGIHF